MESETKNGEWRLKQGETRCPRGQERTYVRPVDESTRIDISAQLRAFQADVKRTSLTFPPTLSNHERAVVHTECRKFGMTSQSEGVGAERCITVYRQTKPAEPTEDSAFQLPLTTETVAAIKAHFQQFPAANSEIELAATGSAEPKQLFGCGSSSASGPHYKRARVGRPATEASAAEVELMRSTLEKLRGGTGEVKQLAEQRLKLPIAEYRQQICNLVQENQVVLLAGETGCGKTTQVPQYLVDQCWERGKPCRVLCTQPRFISARTVAERVAAERGEPIGRTVGYQARHDVVGGPECSLMFCTNSVLLRQLTRGSVHHEMRQITHIVIDEIHERDRYADFMLIVLKDLLPHFPDLHVILMSATLNTEAFSAYFDDCPVLNVPGFTHPVEDFFLEDVLELVGYTGAVQKELRRAGNCVEETSAGENEEDATQVGDLIMKAFLDNTNEGFDMLMSKLAELDYVGLNSAHAGTGATPLMVAASKGRMDAVELLLLHRADVSQKSRDGSNARHWAERFHHPEVAARIETREVEVAQAEAKEHTKAALARYQQEVDPNECDLDLVYKIVKLVHADQPDGAILVFLPGWFHITRLQEKLAQCQLLGDSRKVAVIPLHSQVPSGDQRRAFKRPAAGIRKVVLATNLAETAITIDDVVYVVDTGRVKEKSYDPHTAVSTLQQAWVSRASAHQRRGRAGRCQPGVCFHLYSRTRYASFNAFQLPEIKRSPLEELCLQVKLIEEAANVAAMGLHGESSSHTSRSILDFISAAVEPPLPQAVSNAVAMLSAIGALNAEEHLTSLGRHLAHLPLNPAIGKVLLFGAMFRVLDPLLTVACRTAHRSPFLLPSDPSARVAAEKAKEKFAQEAGGGSDELAVATAYKAWKSSSNKAQFCAQHHLAIGVMNSIEAMRETLVEELGARGFLEGGTLASASVHAANFTLVKSVLAMGLYPMFGRAVPKSDLPPNATATAVTAQGEKVRVTPLSTNARVYAPSGKGVPATILVFEELTRGEHSLSVSDCTAVGAHPILFVAAQVCAAESEKSSSVHLLVDGWLQLGVPLELLTMVACLRIRLFRAFAKRANHPSSQLPTLERDALQLVTRVLQENSSVNDSGSDPSIQAASGQASLSGRRYEVSAQAPKHQQHGLTYSNQRPLATTGLLNQVHGRSTMQREMYAPAGYHLSSAPAASRSINRGAMNLHTGVGSEGSLQQSYVHHTNMRDQPPPFSDPSRMGMRNSMMPPYQSMARPIGDGVRYPNNMNHPNQLQFPHHEQQWHQLPGGQQSLRQGSQGYTQQQRYPSQQWNHYQANARHYGR